VLNGLYSTIKELAEALGCSSNDVGIYSTTILNQWHRIDGTTVCMEPDGAMTIVMPTGSCIHTVEYFDTQHCARRVLIRPSGPVARVDPLPRNAWTHEGFKIVRIVVNRSP
jgi:hypothetical protein